VTPDETLQQLIATLKANTAEGATLTELKIPQALYDLIKQELGEKDLTEHFGVPIVADAALTQH
jgi:hypothetical protein